MSVNLITGNLFSPIQASQDSDYQAGTFGEKTQILNVGSKMAVSIVDNSTIRCEDGVLVTKEGRRVQIDNGDVVEWTIPTGTQGTTSYYIVGFRLYTDDESAQLCDTFVKSMPSESATITEDTFRDGAVEIFVSVARVVQNGVTLESVQSLVPLATTLDQAKGAISRINNDLLHPIVAWNVANTSALFDFDLVNKMANFNLNVFGAGVANGEIIGTLPVGLRPPALTAFGVCGVQDDGNFHWLFVQIYATGEITVSSSDYNSQITNCSYSGSFKIS